MSGDGTGSGTTIAGHALLGELGRSPMHRVVRARRDDGCEVALKYPLGARSGARHLHAEADVLARVVHPHLIGLADLVRLDDGALVGLALDVVDGGTLADHTAEGERLDAATLAQLVRAVADALGALHSAGYAHGDVKPANILLRDDGVPVLADLDAARPVNAGPIGGAPAEAGDASDRVRVTPGFAAPEVGARGEVSPAADVWALGTSALAALDRSSARAGELFDLLGGATADRPDARPSAAELASELEAAFGCEPFQPIAHHHGPSASAVEAATIEWGPRPPAPATSAPAAPRRRAPATLITLAVGGVTAATLTGGVALATGRHDAEPPAEQVQTTDPACSSHAPAAAVLPAVGAAVADTEGDGCGRTVERASDGTVEVTGPGGTSRYAIGAHDDVLLIGDWDGDGRQTPGVYRPTDGTLHLFDRWAARDNLVSAGTPTGVVDGVVHLERDAGRDVVSVSPAQPGR